MLGPLLNFFTQARPTPPMPPPAVHPVNHTEPARTPDTWRIPLAGDGLPLWDAAMFSDRFSQANARPARASLRPQFELLSASALIDGMSVGTTLRSYARMLWDVKQKKVPRSGIAIRIRQRAVYVLGGPGTRRGAEFTRRCRMITRFLMRLSYINENALRGFSPLYAHLVRDEVETLFSQAMYSLVNGLAFDDRSGAGVTTAVRCRIDLDQLDSWLPDWLWRKLSGCP